MPIFGRIRPMLAHSAEKPFDHPDWTFEIKWDGYRCLAFIGGDGHVLLQSRRGADLGSRFPHLLALGEGWEQPLILDGEITAFRRGRPDFSALGPWRGGLRAGARGTAAPTRSGGPGEPAEVKFIVFDVLYVDGAHLFHAPLVERRAVLSRLVDSAGRPARRLVGVSEPVDSKGRDLFRGVQALALEGIVAKRKQSPYRPGERSRDWLKVRNVRIGHFIIGGVTEGRLGGFGSLLVGVWAGGGHRPLRYLGKLGTGFTEGRAAAVLERLEARPSSPFKPGDGGDPVHPPGTIFVEPTVVCTAEYLAWTAGGLLRHGVFRGIAAGKEPEGCRLPRDHPDHPEYGLCPVEIGAAPSRDRSPGTPAPSNSTGLSPWGETAPKPGSGGSAGGGPGAADRGRGVMARVGNRHVRLTNLGRPLWPGEGLTKAHLIEYFMSVEPWLSPHLSGRPLVFTRYPEGIDGTGFYQKNLPEYAPPWVDRVSRWSGGMESEADYAVGADGATLAWLGNQAVIEIHPWSSRVTRPDNPDYVLVDLDPAEGAGFKEAVKVAQRLRDVLSLLGLEGYPKTSGLTGLHVYIPIEPRYTYGEAADFARRLGVVLLNELPGLVTLERAVARRKGRVYVDYLQNGRGKTLAAVYSPRPRPGAPVSFPVAWDDLPRVQPGDFNLITAPDLLKHRGDRFSPLLDPRRRQPLERAMKAMSAAGIRGIT